MYKVMGNAFYHMDDFAWVLINNNTNQATFLVLPLAFVTQAR